MIDLARSYRVNWPQPDWAWSLLGADMPPVLPSVEFKDFSCPLEKELFMLRNERWM